MCGVKIFLFLKDVEAQEYLEGLGGAVAFGYRQGEKAPWKEEMMRGEPTLVTD